MLPLPFLPPTDLAELWHLPATVPVHVDHRPDGKPFLQRRDNPSHRRGLTDVALEE